MLLNYYFYCILCSVLSLPLLLDFLLFQFVICAYNSVRRVSKVGSAWFTIMLFVNSLLLYWNIKLWIVISLWNWDFMQHSNELSLWQWRYFVINLDENCRFCFCPWRAERRLTDTRGGGVTRQWRGPYINHVTHVKPGPRAPRLSASVPSHSRGVLIF